MTIGKETPQCAEKVNRTAHEAGLAYEHKISFICQDVSLNQPVIPLEILRMDYKIPSLFWFSSSVVLEAFVT
jgi:hypothetical protein